MEHTIYTSVEEGFHDVLKPFSIRCPELARQFSFSNSSDESKFRVQLKHNMRVVLKVDDPGSYEAGEIRDRLRDICIYLRHHYGVSKLYRPDPLEGALSAKQELEAYLASVSGAKLIDLIEATLFTKFAMIYCYQTSTSDSTKERAKESFEILEGKPREIFEKMFNGYSLNYKIKNIRVIPRDAPLMAELKQEVINVFSEKCWGNAERELSLAIGSLPNDPEKAVREATKAIESVMEIILHDLYDVEMKEGNRRYIRYLGELKKQGFFDSSGGESKSCCSLLEDSILCQLEETMKKESPMVIRGPQDHGKGKTKKGTVEHNIAELILNLSVSYCWFLVQHYDKLQKDQ